MKNTKDKQLKFMKKHETELNEITLFSKQIEIYQNSPEILSGYA